MCPTRRPEGVKAGTDRVRGKPHHPAPLETRLAREVTCSVFPSSCKGSGAGKGTGRYSTPLRISWAAGETGAGQAACHWRQQHRLILASDM